MCMKLLKNKIISISILVALLSSIVIIPVFAITPTLMGYIAGAGSPNYLNGANDVFVSGNYAYVVSTSDDSLTIVDISNPLTPTLEGYIAGVGSPNYLDGAMAVYVSGNYAYVVAWMDDSLTIVNVTNPASPTIAGHIAGAGSPNYLNSPFSVYVSGNYAYVAASSDQSLTIIDVTNPAAPTIASHIAGYGAPNYLGVPKSVFVSGNYAYVAASANDSLTIVDVTNPLVPTIAGHIAGAGSPNYLDGVEYVYVSGNYAYLTAALDESLTIINVTNPAIPTLAGHIAGASSPNYLGLPQSVYVSGNYAYVAASGDDSLTIINVTIPATPTYAGHIAGAGSPNYLNNAAGVYVVGNYAYVASNYDDSLSVFDISLSAPSITTTAANNISTTTAKLNSSLTNDGNDAGNCQVQFAYGLTSQAVFANYDTLTGFFGTYSEGDYPEYIATGLLMNTTYYFRVQVKNSFSTVTSIELSFTTSTVATVPTNVQAYPQSDSIYLTWSKGSGSNNTYVYYKTSPYTSSNTNLITNGSFETADPPTGWTLAGADSTFSRSNTQYKIGSYSGKLIRSGTDCVVTQDLTTTENGEVITFGCWVYATVANRAYIYIDDGITTPTVSTAHTGGSTWEWLSASQTVDASATHVYLACQVKTGDTTAYFDRAFCIEGSAIPAEGTLKYSGSDSTYTHTGLILGTTYYYALVGEGGGLYSDTYATITMTTTASGLDPTGFNDITNPSSYDITTPDITPLSGLGPFYNLTNGFVDSLGMPRGNAWAGIAALLIVVLATVVYIKSGSLSGALVVVLICLIITYFLKITSGWWIFFALAGVLGSFALPKREV